MTLAGEMRLWARMCCVLVSIIAFVCPAAADGKYFPPVLDVAQDPNIPVQRAILHFADGVETLIIESVVSDLKGADEVGWVLPVPAEPDSIEPVTPGVLQTLRMLLRPEVRTGRATRWWFCVAGLFVLLAVWRCSEHVVGRPVPGLAVLFVASVLAAVFVGGLLLPALSTAGSRGGGSGVEIVSETRVGIFDVAVLRAQDAGDVAKWLKERGFSCPEEAQHVIAAYIAEGWLFAVASLAAGDVSVTPHPVRVTFAVDEPVYPMRLTGVTSQPLALELFVIADKQAHVPKMKQWRAERFVPERVSSHLVSDAAAVRGEVSSDVIAHPELVDLLEGNVLTRLHATLSPEEMDEDIRPLFSELTPHVAASYTQLGAIRWGLLIGLAAVPFLWIVGALGARRRRTPLYQFLRWACTGSIALVGLAAAFATLVLPVVEATTTERPLRTMMRTRGIKAAIVRCWPGESAQGDPVLVLSSPDVLVTDVAVDFSLDVPGGCRIVEVSGGWIATLYDHLGAPHQLLLRDDGTVEEVGTQ